MIALDVYSVLHTALEHPRPPTLDSPHTTLAAVDVRKTQRAVFNDRKTKVFQLVYVRDLPHGIVADLAVNICRWNSVTSEDYLLKRKEMLRWSLDIFVQYLDWHN